MYRMVFKIENGMSSTLSVEHASIQVSVPVESVQDVRFVDDDTVMLAVLEESRCLLHLLIPIYLLTLTSDSFLATDEY